MKHDDIDSLINDIQNLDIQHHTELKSLIDKQRKQREELVNRLNEEHTGDEGTNRARPDVAKSVAATAGYRRTFKKFPDVIGDPLAIGDVVELLSSGRTGKSGDRAVIAKFSEEFVIIRVNSGNTTTRKSWNLRRVIE